MCTLMGSGSFSRMAVNTLSCDLPSKARRPVTISYNTHPKLKCHCACRLPLPAKPPEQCTGKSPQSDLFASGGKQPKSGERNIHRRRGGSESADGLRAKRRLRLCQSEVHKLRTALCQHDVRRLQVAMDDALTDEPSPELGRSLSRSSAPGPTGKGPFSRRAASVCPSRNSMTMKSMPSCAPMSCSVQILACCSEEMARASRSKRCLSSGSAERLERRTFTATVRSRRVSLAQ